MNTVADVLVDRLARLGVRHLFGYPGGQLTPIYDALFRREDMRHILARHEQAAAFMADGYARASGQPGVCLAVCGPGVYNTATALATSHTDSIPVLLISGQVPRSGAGLRSGYYHENEQLQACRHFTKATFRIESADELVHLLESAWYETKTGRPGPVVVEIPVDVLRSPMSPDASPGVPIHADVAEQDLSDAVSMIKNWHRPLILVGGGIIDANPGDELAELATRLGAPVFHTSNGKCALPASHPLHAGMPWAKATSDLSDMGPMLSPLFTQADGLLAIGCRFTQLTTGAWKLPVPKSLVQIDIDPDEIGRHYPVSVGIVGDALQTLGKLLPLLQGENREPWATIPTHSEPWPIGGLDLVGVLQRVLPADAILAADVTRLAYALMARYRSDAPRGWLHPSGSVAMGYGIPAALGARVARPDAPIVAIVGDGGFQMSALELATAMQEKLPIVILLVNDSCLTLIKATQERHYPGRYVAVDLHNPDFVRLAEAFNVPAHRCRTEAEIEAALRGALANGGTTLVEVMLG